MGLINADQFLGILSVYRLIWIGGRFGGYKTSLAYMLAERYLKHGYRLITNNKCVWADDYTSLDLLPNGHLKAVVILDEGGIEFKASRQIEEIATYSAKMDVIYIIPSFYPPVRSAQVVTVQPLFNFKGIGLPLIVYKWRVKLNAFEEHGNFMWFRPSYIYGIYSRQDPGARTEKIVKSLIQWKEDYRRRYDHDDTISEVAEVTEAELLQDAAGEMAQAADTFASIPVRRYRRR